MSAILRSSPLCSKARLPWRHILAAHAGLPLVQRVYPNSGGGLSSSDLFLAHLVVSVTQSLEAFVQAEGVGQSQALADSLLAHISCRQSIRPVTGVLAHPDRQSSFGYKKRASDCSSARCEDNSLVPRPTG